ncbi:hypothetical protein EYF80_030762 [Liparis tanakae]|uniref:Uncharacterized protein n=1 Tax=Liparis tanakae TaxID=230148 RepID=A0A4Z2H2I0_9TELE|nr:hypothetical protein EYF80_030762 [Liparis tanakae]
MEGTADSRPYQGPHGGGGGGHLPSVVVVQLQQLLLLLAQEAPGPAARQRPEQQPGPERGPAPGGRPAATGPLELQEAPLLHDGKRSPEGCILRLDPIDEENDEFRMKTSSG